MGYLKYKFYCTHNAVTTEVNPLGFINNCSFVYERQKDTIFFQRKLRGKLLFCNKNGTNDYTYFKAIEDADNQCDVISFEIKRSCDNGVTYSSYWTGSFGTIDGDWDLDKCTFSVEPLTEGYFDCIMSGVEVNAIDGSLARVTANYSIVGIPPDEDYERCILFEDVLEFIATQSCSSITGIKSDFFQINPDTVSTVNYASGSTNKLTELVIGAKSDMKDPIPSDAATFVYTTFQRFMDNLRYLFNVYWTIEGTTLRIEHISYFEGSTGLDLTQSQYDKYTSGTNKYSYDRQDSPKYETWSISDSVDTARIVYDNACGNQKANESDKKYTVDLLYTQITKLRLVPGDVKSIEGLVLLATEFNAGTGKYDILNGLGGNPSELMLSKLVLDFHRNNRPQINGEFVGSANYFSREELLIHTTKPLKKQVSITIPFCCDEEFDVEDNITTDLGIGNPDQAEYFPKSSTLKLDIAYPVGENENIEPDEIEGLQLWLDADDANPIGAISTWTDKSGNGHDATQATGANQPTKVSNVINGKPVIRFDGTNDGMSIAAFQAFPAKRGSLFIVSKSNDDATSDFLIGNFTASVPWRILTVPKTPNTYKGYTYTDGVAIYDITRDDLTSLYGYDDEFVLLTLIREADDAITVYHDGLKSTQGSPNGYFAVANEQPSSDIINIGADNSVYLSGDIAEIILYDRALTEPERQKVERYLKFKYALSMYVI